MPCLYISTNINLDGVDIDPIFSEATTAISTIIGKPEKFVMVLLKGSVPISFAGNKEPAAYGEIVSMGGINKEVKRNLIATIAPYWSPSCLYQEHDFFSKSLTQQHFGLTPNCDALSYSDKPPRLFPNLEFNQASKVVT